MAETVEARRERARRQRAELAKVVNDYKAEQGCQLCDEKDPRALDLHHHDPLGKINNVSNMVSSRMSLDSIKNEMEKCVVICCNCHRKLHRDLIFEEA